MNIFLLATIIIVTLFFPLKWRYKYIVPGVAIVFILWVSIELLNQPKDKDFIYYYSILFKAALVSLISFLVMVSTSYIKEKFSGAEENCAD